MCIGKKCLNLPSFQENIITVENKKKKIMSLGVKVLVNLLLMFAVGVLLVWLGTIWLDSWTNHGEAIEVPDVKGMQYDAACNALEKADFEVVLSDSIYDNKTKPGCVIEQNPKVGTKVKIGRTVYLTVNAFSPRSVTIPALTDVSLRQAESILEGLGIKDIVVKEVPSEFKDLVLSATRRGQRLMAGARIPVNSQVVLEVGAGLPDEDINADSDSTANTVSVETLDLF